MKSKNALCGLTIAVVLQFGVLAGSAQTNKYLFSGSEMNITLPPGTYIITAYGAPGSGGYVQPVNARANPCTTPWSYVGTGCPELSSNSVPSGFSVSACRNEICAPPGPETLKRHQPTMFCPMS